MSRIVEAEMDSLTAHINGGGYPLLVEPQIIDGRIVMGVIDLANLLGAKLTFSGKKITLTIE